MAVLRQLREAHRPCVREFRGLADATQEAARSLKRVWLLGNRPSRLRDNLSGMRRTLAEYRKMMRA